MHLASSDRQVEPRYCVARSMPSSELLSKPTRLDDLNRYALPFERAKHSATDGRACTGL